MIKLVDLLNEAVSNLDPNQIDGVEDFNNMHWRDHAKAILIHTEKILNTKDPETINFEISEILKHANSLDDKHYATYDNYAVDKSSTPSSGFHSGNADF